MHYSLNRALASDFLHWCASSPFDDKNQSQRGGKGEERVHRMVFLLGTLNFHLLWNSCSFPVDLLNRNRSLINMSALTGAGKAFSQKIPRSGQNNYDSFI